MAETKTENVTRAQEAYTVSKAKEFVQLWIEGSSTLKSDYLTNYTLESIIKFLNCGQSSNLQKVPDLERAIKENKSKQEELKRKQDSLIDKIKRIATEVDLIEDDANQCKKEANAKCDEIMSKITLLKQDYEEKLQTEKMKQLEEVKRQREHMHRAMKCEQMKIIDQYQAKIKHEELEWQKLIEFSESKRKWRSLDEFRSEDKKNEDNITIRSNNAELELIVSESEEILEERKIVSKELTFMIEEPVQPRVLSISVKTKTDGKLIETIHLNQSELASMNLAGFRAIATVLPAEFIFLSKGRAPVRLAQENKLSLKAVLDGEIVWIKIS